MSIRRHQLHLSTVFRNIVLLSLGSAAATQACSSSSSGSGGGADGGRDGHMAGDDGGSGGDSTTTDAAGDSRTPGDGMMAGDSPADSGVDQHSCTRSAPYYTDASYVSVDGAAPDALPCELGLAPAIVFVDYPCGIEGESKNMGTGTEACDYTTFACEGLSGPALCPLDAGVPVSGCFLAEGKGCLDGALTAQTGQSVTVQCETCPLVGRRPAGLRRPSRRPAGVGVGAFFAEVSHFEAASVLAFHRLHDELQAHGAPAHLSRAARRSARDETRHARVTAQLARRFGADAPAKASVRGSRGPRALGRVVLENAVEGCVRETFGAMLATWQAAHASDAGVRRSMTRIAADETRHAALAWAVAAWADTRLDEAARARLHRARARAVRQLASDAMFTLPAHVRGPAGLPSTRQARSLVAALTKVWS